MSIIECRGLLLNLVNPAWQLKKGGKVTSHRGKAGKAAAAAAAAAPPAVDNSIDWRADQENEPDMYTDYEVRNRGGAVVFEKEAVETLVFVL